MKMCPQIYHPSFTPISLRYNVSELIVDNPSCQPCSLRHSVHEPFSEISSFTPSSSWYSVHQSLIKEHPSFATHHGAVYINEPFIKHCPYCKPLSAWCNELWTPRHRPTLFYSPSWYNVHKRSSKTALLGTIYINPHQKPPLILTALLGTIFINPHQRLPLSLTALLGTIYLNPYQRPPLILTALLSTIYINPLQRTSLSLAALLGTNYINPHRRPSLFTSSSLWYKLHEPLIKTKNKINPPLTNIHGISYINLSSKTFFFNSSRGSWCN